MAFAVVVVFVVVVVILMAIFSKEGRQDGARLQVEGVAGPSGDGAEEQAASQTPSTPAEVIVEMVGQGDWAGARRALQKLAYGMVDAPQAEKAEFTRFMMEFARVDPLYRDCLAAIAPIVAANPGIRQTALYEHMPTGDVDEARYVLYFAHEIGDIARRKKGNTYEVFPADYAVELVAPAVRAVPKRRRRAG